MSGRSKRKPKTPGRRNKRNSYKSKHLRKETDTTTKEIRRKQQKNLLWST